MDIQTYIKQCQHRVILTLKKNLPSLNKEPRQLHQAMHYAVLNGGKRLRSAFIFATGEALNAKPSLLNNIAAAIEMIHAYSLIHDDLPALDNDDLRRGKPTCHKVFGEATTILAGNALQSLAFEILSTLNKKDVPASSILEMIQLIASSIGSMGMIGGEELDIKMEGQSVSLKKLTAMYKLKTGCLLRASIILSALAANSRNKKILHNLAQFSENIGLAFQIHDDIIGIKSDTKTLGKTQGADITRNKPIYPVLVGMAKAKQKEQSLYRKALIYLDKTGINTEKLKALSAYIIERNY